MHMCKVMSPLISDISRQHYHLEMVTATIILSPHHRYIFDSEIILIICMVTYWCLGNCCLSDEMINSSTFLSVSVTRSEVDSLASAALCSFVNASFAIYTLKKQLMRKINKPVYNIFTVSKISVYTVHYHFQGLRDHSPIAYYYPYYLSSLSCNRDGRFQALVQVHLRHGGRHCSSPHGNDTAHSSNRPQKHARRPGFARLADSAR